MAFTIYHIPEIRKVGCTRDFDRRSEQNRARYGEHITIEILEVLDDAAGPQRAGDVEWKWASHFGYPRRNHYTQRWSAVLTKEELSNAGSKGAKNVRLGDYTPEFREHHRIGFEHNSWYNRSEKHKQDAARGAKIAASNKSLGMQTQSQCPHCGKIGQTSVMGRWHFDNCKSKPGNADQAAKRSEEMTKPAFAG
jgi:hypothetical protein